MKLHELTALTALAIASPAVAQPSADNAAGEARAVVDRFTESLARRDVERLAALFATDAAVLESGRYEGLIGDYVAHHLGPELAAFDSFQIQNRKVDVQVVGDVAWAREEYDYAIRAKGRVGEIQRRCVSSVVLKRVGGTWRIVQLHLSSRAR